MRSSCCALIILSAAAAAAVPQAADAQQYPAKPIRMIVPFTPGGSTDVIARVIAHKLSETMGVQVLIDNRPGAGGNIGVELTAKSPPDGYTLVMGHIGTMAVNPTLYKRLPYDPVRDFAPVALVALVPNLLAIHPALPVKTPKELIALARANPGRLNYGSSGAGGTPYLACEYLKLAAKLDITHVPYKGAAPMAADLAAGQVEMTITGIPSLLPFVRSNRVRVLAVTSAQRIAFMPNVPTLAETVLPGFEAISWYGVLAPAATPKDIVARLNAEIVKAAANPDTAERLSAEGANPSAGTPEQFGAFIKSEIVRWGKVIKATGSVIE